MNARYFTIATSMLKDGDFDLTTDRVRKLVSVIGKIPLLSRKKLRLETCAHGGGDQDRYGKAQARAGFAERIGIERRDGKQLQIWAVWN